MKKCVKMLTLSLLIIGFGVVESRAEMNISWLAPLIAAENFAVAQSTSPGYCLSDGSCSATTPACGQTTIGTDNCGNQCSKTGPACPVPTSMNSSANPATIQRGGASIVTANVLDQFGQALGGVNISFNVQGGSGSVSPSSAVTDAAGRASVTFTAPDHFQGHTVQSIVRSAVSGSLSSDVIITTTKK